MKIKNISKATIFFYVMALLFIVAFVLTFYNVTIYILSLMEESNLSFAESWLDIILYYISNTAVFLGFGAVLGGIGYGIQLLKTSLNVPTTEAVKSTSVQEETV